MLRWNFPGNDGGQIKGVADAGIETFNGTELASLARENCQNSLDVPRDEENPCVVVEFERYQIPVSKIPGIDDYRQILENCQGFWEQSNSDKAKNFLKKAVTNACKENSYVLRISDYNTTGLADPYGKRSDVFSFDGWNSLVKIDGGANKGEDKAGAFGIGKSAPFSNSHFRLVFYRTINEDGEHAAQGVSRIVSFPKDITKPKENITTGVGYYGESEGNLPVETIPELEELNHRDDIGTDVFVYGFNSISNEWEFEIIYALLESFLMSIYRNQLIVKVQNRLINSSTLGAFMEQAHRTNPSETRGTYGNYLALTRDNGVYSYEKPFHGLGTLKLRVLVDPEEKLDRKILVVRKAGMKLFRLGNISRLVPFTGILELEGLKLNAYFRKMESVAHDSWEPGRHDNPKQAKAYYEEIKDWIKEIVANLAESSCEDEVEVKGLSGVLQAGADQGGPGDSDEKRESLNDQVRTIEILKRPPAMKTRGFFYGEGTDGTNEYEETSGTLGPDGRSGVRLLRGKRKRKKLEKHRGVADPDGRDVVFVKKEGGKVVAR